MPTPRPLAPRELEIVALVAEGLSTSDIAEKLDIASDTVQGALSTIYLKLGVRSRAQLVRWAFLNGHVKMKRTS